MKEQDNITQLYQDAFSDFEVQAPAEVYAKVQNQLGRKSLLTLDPTRLNVFYLALMSGIVAWALLGNNPAEPVVETQQNTEAVTEIVQSPVEESSESTISLVEENEAQVQEIAESTSSAPILNERVPSYVSQSSQQPDVSSNELASEVNSGNSIDASSAVVDTNSEMTNTEENQNDNSLANAGESNTEIQEAVDQIEENKRDTPAQSVRGKNLEDPSKFLYNLKHDRDGKASAKISK